MNVLYASRTYLKNENSQRLLYFTVLIREVVEKRLNSYERKEGSPPSKWEEELEIPERKRDSTINYLTQEPSTLQAQKRLSDTEYLRAPSIDRGPPTQERKPVEEEFQGPDDDAEMRRSLDTEDPTGASEL